MLSICVEQLARLGVAVDEKELDQFVRLRDERDRVIKVIDVWRAQLDLDPFLMELDKLDERDLAKSIETLLRARIKNRHEP